MVSVALSGVAPFLSLLFETYCIVVGCGLLITRPGNDPGEKKGIIRSHADWTLGVVGVKGT